MRKSIKKIAASILAATMVLGSMTFASASETDFDEADFENGEVYYTLAGGMTGWAPSAKANQLKETNWDGVYSINIDLPAFDEATEGNNRFKICRIDDVTYTNGWLGAICLGTTVAEDNQTTFRVECAEAITGATVYLDANTGAVVIMSGGNEVDYKFSWVGADNQVQYTTVSDFATCEITWPEDKVKADVPTDMEARYDALLAKVTGKDLADESLYENGAVKYTVAGGSSTMAWAPESSLNEMKETVFDGVYSFGMNLPAFDVNAEHLNRFKICRLDDVTCSNGWFGAICLGTTVAEDNQTTFRVENTEAMAITVYYDSNNGAVVVKNNADGSVVDYNFSWVGADNQVQYTTVSKFDTCGIEWPADKVKADVPTDMVKNQETLIAKLNGKDLADETLYEDGKVKYTVAGGSSPMAWAPESSANEMKESDIKGVYTFKMSLPAFDEANAEHLNRFKICRLDDVTCSNGWLGAICLGTTVAEDNQTTFRVENTEAMDITIYFQPETGAVVIFDAEGKEVDYNFSWVGADDEVQYTTVSKFATCGIDYEKTGKVRAEVPSDLADKYATLVKLIKEGPQTETPSVEAPSAQAPTTTAQNQATQTGDAAPVALLFLLVAAVAVVTVVAKKKEA